MPVPNRSRLGTRGKPEESRAAILKAAINEFSEHGIAGARTDAIAGAARVNKALLYYYFKDKEAIYQAVLDQVFSGLRDTVVPTLDGNLPPRQKVLNYLGAYFDYIETNPCFPRVVQGEWIRGRHRPRRTDEARREELLPAYLSEARRSIEEGVAAGEFRPIDPAQFIPSMVAVIIFYFSAAPVIKTLMKVDPLAPERIAERRAFVLDFISAALLTRPAPAQGGRS